MQITVIGGGLIGLSWAALFLAHGHRVTVLDPTPEIATRGRATIARIQPVLAALGHPFDVDHSELHFTHDLEQAVREADVIQECGPERLGFKRDLWVEVERHATPRALCLSSSSGITASMQAARMRTPQRLLIAHPFNPPHLMPLVELVPGRRTAPEATEAAKAFMTSLGKHVVVLHKEIPGFVANRIQAAVIRESVSLVRQGVVSTRDLDTAITQSLGLRWAVGGPFLSAHLGGGEAGIQGFFRQFATGLQLLWLHMRLRPVWLHRSAQDDLSRRVLEHHGDTPIATLAARRDHLQLAVLQALRQATHPSEPTHEKR